METRFLQMGRVLIGQKERDLIGLKGRVLIGQKERDLIGSNLEGFFWELILGVKVGVYPGGECSFFKRTSWGFIIRN